MFFVVFVLFLNALSCTRCISIDSRELTYTSQRLAVIQSLTDPCAVNAYIILEAGFHFRAGSTSLLPHSTQLPVSVQH